jgi:SMC interacting uncharacterized protein involved in chromosome segregation
MGTDAENHEPNNPGKRVPSEIERLRAELQATREDLECVAAHRDALKLALVEQGHQNHELKKERNEAWARNRQLRRLCVEHQSMIGQLMERLGACIHLQKQAERLAGMVAPSDAKRIVRIPGITIGGAS